MLQYHCSPQNVPYAAISLQPSKCHLCCNIIAAKTKTMRQQLYQQLYRQAESLIEGETNQTGILANITALLKSAFPERFFWVGFYIVKDNQLLLGPFQGTVACFRIGYGKGVCGTCWQRGETVIVDDVEQFPGHIACSSLSRSEIVIPVKDVAGHTTAVLDIDSTELSAFDETDRIGLERICTLIKIEENSK